MRVKISDKIKRLLDLVSKQEKKYKKRLLPPSNYHLRHNVVRNFLQIQVNTQSNLDQFMQKRTYYCIMSETITCFFR